ncbi:hypothetical protein SAMN04488057_102262 [Cyclobacterium lianum]|uniref:Uncharacterized protein n=1 Tax=Cyclobacterium lianum TaxID=388280 RepID=A0A1M7K3P3_9BACT|nr:hypothetical protein [Cyclobacterium lianum]SHM59437.1 hypothetical protein SAMN04488057_102262 [Cyclobacterium lianum]
MFKELNFSICLLLCLVISSEAQIVRHFEVKEREDINLVLLNFSSYKGVSTIQREYRGYPLIADAELGKVNILPTFTHNYSDGVLYAMLEHKNVESESLSKNLSYRLFSSSDEDFDHKWKVGLDANYLYDLRLQFGIGKARLDLSNLPVSNCFVKTASADVFLNYSRQVPNSVNMDTLSVAINMGSLYAEDLQMSNARHLMFDVNYGSVNLAFGDAMAATSTINAMVGAGTVNIKLPAANLPYVVKIKSTAMCRTKVPGHLREIAEKTYISKGYRADAENLMTFMIDVSVGSVSLE